MDGGITDNTGILALYDLVEMTGGIKPYMQDFQKAMPLKMVVIEANASAIKTLTWDYLTKNLIH